MMVEMACLYTSWDWPSRRSRTQKLSNQLTTPCSFTPLTRKMVSGVFDLRTLFRNVSWRFCFFSADIGGSPLIVHGGPHAPHTNRSMLDDFSLKATRSQRKFPQGHAANRRSWLKLLRLQTAFSRARAI